MLTRHARKRRRKDAERKKRVRGVVFATALAVEIGSLWFRAHRLGGRVTVRCRQGHLFSTIWIPAVSLKALRLGPWRAQRCPVGKHWTLVTPVRDSTLSDEERRSAAEHRDVRLP